MEQNESDQRKKKYHAFQELPTQEATILPIFTQTPIFVISGGPKDIFFVRIFPSRMFEKAALKVNESRFPKPFPRLCKKAVGIFF